MNAFDSSPYDYDCSFVMPLNEEHIVDVQNDSAQDFVIENSRTTTFHLEIPAVDVAVYALRTVLCTKGRPTCPETSSRKGIQSHQSTKDRIIGNDEMRVFILDGGVRPKSLSMQILQHIAVTPREVDIHLKKLFVCH